MEENIAWNQQFYRQNSPVSYLHRQFNDRYINSFIVNVYFRRYIFQGWIALQAYLSDSPLLNLVYALPDGI